MADLPISDRLGTLYHIVLWQLTESHIKDCLLRHLMEMLIKNDMRDFIAAYESLPLDPKTIGVPGSLDDAADRIKRVFGI